MMNLLLSALTLCLGTTLASFDLAYKLIQDEENETYFLEVYVGT